MPSTLVNSVTNLRLKYPGEENVLFRGLSLQIRRGEKVLLLGPSGGGKSTLLQVMSGLVPDALELPMKCDERTVPERWGYVFQDPETQFCMSYADEEIAFTLENVNVPREQMPERIRYYLEKVGLHLDDPHVPIATFSQGMKQRLAIAAVLALEPDVLFLDEPTALLDPEGTEQVWETIRNLGSEQTLIIVEHKIHKVLAEVDRVILLSEQGEIAADQSPDRFFTERRESMMESGIWYPDVWRDYDANRQVSGREEEPGNQGDIILKLRNFNGYRGDQPRIHVDQATVQSGDWTSVIGPNGAGKSTLLLAIMRLIKTEGQCEVAGYSGHKTADIARHVGFVFQNPEMQFLTDSVLEELEISMTAVHQSREQRHEAAKELLKRFGLDGLGDRHPYQLSVGQKRRLSVATAISGGKKLLLLDEPTFGLDARSTFQMLELLEELRQDGAAIIMVTHDRNIVERFSTAVWHVEDGVLREGEA